MMGMQMIYKNFGLTVYFQRKTQKSFWEGAKTPKFDALDAYDCIHLKLFNFLKTLLYKSLYKMWVHRVALTSSIWM